MSASRPLPTEDDLNVIREGVRAVCSHFGDDYWLARDDNGKFPHEFHHAMAEMLEANGLTGDRFAPLVFDAIEHGEYWIIPQPEAFEPGFSNRNAVITARRQPQFYLVEDQAQ